MYADDEKEEISYKLVEPGFISVSAARDSMTYHRRCAVSNLSVVLRMLSLEIGNMISPRRKSHI